MRFLFPHSHAFHGGHVTVEDDGADGSGGLVAFGDGVTLIAQWHPVGDALHLAIPAYRTARGTGVVARNWMLARRKDGSWQARKAP